MLSRIVNYIYDTPLIIKHYLKKHLIILLLTLIMYTIINKRKYYKYHFNKVKGILSPNFKKKYNVTFFLMSTHYDKLHFAHCIVCYVQLCNIVI